MALLVEDASLRFVVVGTQDGQHDVHLTNTHEIELLEGERILTRSAVKLTAEQTHILAHLENSVLATVPSEQLPQDALEEFLTRIFEAEFDAARRLN